MTIALPRKEPKDYCFPTWYRLDFWFQDATNVTFCHSHLRDLLDARIIPGGVRGIVGKAVRFNRHYYNYKQRARIDQQNPDFNWKIGPKHTPVTH